MKKVASALPRNVKDLLSFRPSPAPSMGFLRSLANVPLSTVFVRGVLLARGHGVVARREWRGRIGTFRAPSGQGRV